MNTARLISLIFVLAVALARPSRGANVLYLRDEPIGPDRVVEALGALGHDVILAADADDFRTRIEAGGYELGIVFVQKRPAAEYAAAIQSLSAFVDAGGRALYADWSRNAALAAQFGAGYTGRGRERSVAQVSLDPGTTIVPDAIRLRNTGWFQPTSGLTALPGSTVAARFPNGDAAIVRGISGRSLVFGFLSDAPDAAAIFARGAEAVLAPADRPLVTLAAEPATPALHAATLRATIVPSNATTTVAVDYGLSADYDEQTPVQSLGSGFAPVLAEMTLTGLPAHTTVHYRFRASNLAGTTSTADRTFTTLNTSPIARDDRVALPNAGTFTFQPLLNDTDADGDTLAVIAVTSGQFGTATFKGRDVTYTPGAGGLRGDQFTCTIGDGFGGTATATVRIDPPLAAFRGDYSQLLTGPGGIAGRLDLVLTAGGSFTGRLLLDGRSDAISGTFGPDGIFRLVKNRVHAPSVVLSLAMRLPGESPKLAGEIREGARIWNVDSPAVAYDTVHRPFGESGRFTLVVPDSQQPKIPRGEAWAIFAGSPDGHLRLSGRFGDGAIFFGDAVVQPDGTIPLYLLRRSPPVQVLAGTLRFGGQHGTDLKGEVTWTRWSATGAAIFSATSSALGGGFRTPAQGRPLFRFTPGVAPRARATLTAEARGFPLTRMFDVDARHVSAVNPRDDRFTLQFSRTTGLFIGSFNHRTLGPCSIRGVLLQGENVVRGNFSGDGISGAFRLAPR